MPLHAHLLPDERVLFHGYHRDHAGDMESDPVTLANDATWILDPADPRLDATADRDLSVTVFFPPSASPTQPVGLRRRDDQRDWEEGEALLCAGHTWLADGTLFYAGGTAFERDTDPSTLPNPGGNHGDLIAVGTRRGARFDPFAAAWRLTTSSRLGGRYYPTNTRLPDGRIVVASGYFDTESYPNPAVEVFTPGPDTWAPLVDTIRPGETLASNDPRLYLYPSAQDYVHAYLLMKPWAASVPAAQGLARQVAILGVTGRVHLLAVDGGTGLDRVVIPPNGRRPGVGGEEVWRNEGATGVMLPDGRIAAMGGSTTGGYGNRVDIYDPRPASPGFDSWDSFRLCDAAGACTSRHQGSALYLPDGRIALVAGRDQDTADQTRERELVNVRATVLERSPAFIDWRTRSVSFGSPWPDELVRTQHTVALLLADGRVMIAGGRRHYCNPDCSDEQPTLRIYSPDYLDPALAPWRPRIAALRDAQGRAFATTSSLTAVPLGALARVTLTSEAPAAASGELRFALVALGSVTHRWDQNLRYVEVSHTAGTATGELTLEFPRDGYVTPPGPYLLFAMRTVVTGAGPVAVPSMGMPLLLR